MYNLFPFIRFFVLFVIWDQMLEKRLVSDFTVISQLSFVNAPTDCSFNLNQNSPFNESNAHMKSTRTIGMQLNEDKLLLWRNVFEFQELTTKLNRKYLHILNGRWTEECHRLIWTRKKNKIIPKTNVEEKNHRTYDKLYEESKQNRFSVSVRKMNGFQVKSRMSIDECSGLASIGLICISFENKFLSHSHTRTIRKALRKFSLIFCSSSFAYFEKFRSLVLSRLQSHFDFENWITHHIDIKYAS